MRGLGRQLVVELWDCTQNTNDAEAIREGLYRAVERAGASVIGVHVHSFKPHGVSGMAMLSESHISVHTWPEIGYVAVDVFTCGEDVTPEGAVEVLRDLFRPERTSVIEIRRGLQ
ncbi:MAG: adenosylmethionine decarboxylase [Candidatus Bipolaricaulis anaerobius]|nr:adenosylmethionine decarboxylase [Candidatus Bipolaricaulis anaerobius]MDD5763778.1 adenosylmethionine decarboxylase [Candidatus Bipolaricaulis anaerobius]